jgi:hypothetical protein
MSDLPHAADTSVSDADTLGAIPPVVTATYCSHCGRSRTKGGHTSCNRALDEAPPTYCTSCRRELTVTTEGACWTAVCKKHGETTGTLPG